MTMGIAELLFDETATDSRVCTATVIGQDLAGRILVACTTPGEPQLSCEVLYTSEAPVRLAPGDMALIYRLGEDAGIVIGRVGASRAPADMRDAGTRDSPDECVIQANKSLALKCGGGSIVIREDGRILIKGKEIVSHAQRMNRIKGGAVAIN